MTNKEIDVSKYLEPLSYSRIRLLAMGCPRKFKMNYIDKKEPERSIEGFENGKRAHGLVEDFLAGKSEDVSDFNEAVQETLINLKKDFKITVEEKIYRSIPEMMYHYTGYLDILAEDENTVIILDAKNRFYSTSPKFDNIQLQLYAHGYETTKEKKIGNLNLLNPYEPIKWLELESEESFFKKLKAEIRFLERKLFDMFKFKSFQPTGIGCRFCPYIQSCDYKWKEQDPETWAKGLEKLIEEEGILKGKLKTYTANTGEIVLGGDYQWGFLPMSVNEIDKALLLTLCVEKGVNIFELANIDVKKLKKLIRIDEDFSSVLTIESKSRFGKQRKRQE